MTYKDAKKLRSGDNVFEKGTGIRLIVIEVEVEDKNVFIRCDDGKLYHHTAIH